MHSPCSTRKSSCTGSEWYLQLGCPGCMTCTLTPVSGHDRPSGSKSIIVARRGRPVAGASAMFMIKGSSMGQPYARRWVAAAPPFARAGRPTTAR